MDVQIQRRQAPMQFECELTAMTLRIHVDSSLSRLDVQLVKSLLITECLNEFFAADLRAEWLTVCKPRRPA